MLRVVDLSKSFGSRTLWCDLAFTVPPGSMVGLVGASGAGKSTLLNCIGLLQSPDSGDIVFDGVSLLSLTPSARRRFRRDTLGYLFQNYALVEDATVWENLKLSYPKRPSRAEFAETLNSVGLEGRLDARVSTLSGGEQQRVALARIICRSARLILADEPTGALDDVNSDEVIAHLRRLADSGAAVVVATHDGTVQKACDEVIALA